MYGLSGFAKKLNSTDMLNVPNWVNSTGNYVHQMFRLFGFAENLNSSNTLNVQNCVNSM